MAFADQQAYETYNNHSLHTAFIEKYWIPGVEDFLETDYELY
jgi:hypothetical protein